MPQGRVLLRLILLVSCAHSMVHLLEQSNASVEQVVSEEFGLSKEQSGLMGSSLRLPYGLGALLAGILADRLGARRVLRMFLTGSAIVCASFLLTSHAWLMYAQLFALGCFASMYHPAGLALLTTSVPAASRSRALGIHGVMGSLGIASAPLLAAVTMTLDSNGWRAYYVLIAGLALILSLQFRARPGSRAQVFTADGNPVTPHASGESVGPPTVGPPSVGPANSESRPAPPVTSLAPSVATLQILPYGILVLSAAIAGVIYGGFLHFLERYLSESSGSALAGPASTTAAGWGSALILACGALGQFIAGRIARPRHLPELLAIVYALNAPLLWWMANAEGAQRMFAAGLFAFVHFMSQPVYNSLLPDYVPSGRRSTWFGFSNMMGFGFGALGPYLVGTQVDFRGGYSLLACLALAAATFPLILRRFPRSIE